MSERGGDRKRDGRSRGEVPARMSAVVPLKVVRVFDGKIAWHGRARAQPLVRGIVLSSPALEDEFFV